MLNAKQWQAARERDLQQGGRELLVAELEAARAKFAEQVAAYDRLDEVGKRLMGPRPDDGLVQMCERRIAEWDSKH